MGDEGQWDHYRTFEVVSRLGSLTAASRALRVSQSTVSRHLARLEEVAGSPLWLRGSPIRLTERGEALLMAIRPMVGAALMASAALEETPELRGEVTITTVGEVLRWHLVHRLDTFLDAHPKLRLRILADNQVTSLAAGDADVALRMFRPERGDLVARRLRVETYGFFVASGGTRGPEVPWLGLTGSLAGISDQRHAYRAFAGREPRLLVEDIESLGRAVEGGLGVAILPSGLATKLEVERVAPAEVGAKDLGPIPKRELWMVVHRSKRQVPRVRAVMDWLQSSWDT